MASEDLFANYSDDVVAEIHSENSENVYDDREIEEETEDMTGGADDDAAVIEENTTNNNSTKESAGKQFTNEDETVKPTPPTEKESRPFQLPFTRIRNLMKLDPDLHIASHEAGFVVTRATELFIESLARESYIYTAQAKKKTVQKRDVDMAIAAVDSLMFLDGAMNF